MPVFLPVFLPVFSLDFHRISLVFLTFFVTFCRKKSLIFWNICADFRYNYAEFWLFYDDVGPDAILARKWLQKGSFWRENFHYRFISEKIGPECPLYRKNTPPPNSLIFNRLRMREKRLGKMMKKIIEKEYNEKKFMLSLYALLCSEQTELGRQKFLNRFLGAKKSHNLSLG